MGDEDQTELKEVPEGFTLTDDTEVDTDDFDVASDDLLKPAPKKQFFGEEDEIAVIEPEIDPEEELYFTDPYGENSAY